MTEQIEKARLAAVAAFLDSEDTFQGFGFGSQAINAGFVGKVEKFEMTPVQGAGISKRQDPQVLNLKSGAVTVAEKDDNSTAPSLVFEGGARQLTINTLVAHPDSALTLADGTTVNFVKMTGKQWKDLIGKTIECVEARNDEGRMIPRIKRYGQPGETELRPTRYYEFKVNA
jgi:hypothetical protein